MSGLVPMKLPSTFPEAVSHWREAAVQAAQARMKYEVANAKALAESKGSNESARRAEATLATASLKLDAELAEIEAKALHHVVLFLRGADDDEVAA
jgi:hypothetical protein